VRLKVRRLGGIAGVALRSHVDTTELPTDEAAGIERAIRDRAGQTPPAPPRPDAFRYEISAPDEPELDDLILHEHEVPPELRGLVESLKSSGEIESGNG
jgi:Emfourin